MGIIEIFDLSIGISLQMMTLVLVANGVVFLRWYMANKKTEDQKLKNSITESIYKLTQLSSEFEEELGNHRTLLRDIYENLDDYNYYLSEIKDETEAIRELLLHDLPNAREVAPIRGRPGRKRKEIPYKKEE